MATYTRNFLLENVFQIFSKKEKNKKDSAHTTSKSAVNNKSTVCGLTIDL